MVLFFIFKKLLSTESTDEPITKKLMNFISNDSSNKELLKNSNYDTICNEKFKNNKNGNSNSKGENNSFDKSSRDNNKGLSSEGINKIIFKNLKYKIKLMKYF